MLGYLNHAQELLGTNTLAALSTLPSHPRDSLILDRWAVDSPDQLLDLLGRGLQNLHSRVREQREMELDALSQPQARSMLKAGMAETDILETMGIATALPTT